MSDETLLAELAEACRGLVFISEIDAEITTFTGPTGMPLTAMAVLEMLGRDTTTPIDERSVDDLIVRLTTAKDWHGETQKERAKRFQELFSLLKKYLRQLKVFRVGRVRIDIYILGLADSGRPVGIKTAAVET